MRRYPYTHIMTSQRCVKGVAMPPNVKSKSAPVRDHLTAVFRAVSDRIRETEFSKLNDFLCIWKTMNKPVLFSYSSIIKAHSPLFYLFLYLYTKAILDPRRFFTISFYYSYIASFKLQMFPFHSVVISLAAQHSLQACSRRQLQITPG